MVISSQIVLGLFKSTSHDLVVEYNELDAIEELKMSLGNLLVISSSYVLYGMKDDKVYFASQMHHTNEKLENTKNILTDTHDYSTLADLSNSLAYTDSVAIILFSLQIPDDQEYANELLTLISKEINDAINDMDLLVIETKNEIDEYVEINETVIKHSTITMLSLGFVVILIIVIGGSLFIRNITNPIKELVDATRRISKGERKVKVSSTANEELNDLAHSFNEMIDVLRETTVSKNSKK
jgi:nitrogen fixation/metabolism regulation signal transduction histidine kinase